MNFINKKLCVCLIFAFVLMISTPAFAMVMDDAGLSMSDKLAVIAFMTREEQKEIFLETQEEACVTQKEEVIAISRELRAKQEAEEEAKRQEALKKEAEAKKKAAVCTKMIYTAQQFRAMGAVNHNGYRYTWYSERVLPGQGLAIPGRHGDEQGYICDEDEYICVASCDFAKGTVVDTPFGKKGKVYDYCPSHGTMDIYVNW